VDESCGEGYLNERVIGGEHHERLCRLIFVLGWSDPFHDFTVAILVGLLPDPLLTHKELIIIVGENGGRESPRLSGS